MGIDGTLEVVAGVWKSLLSCPVRRFVWPCENPRSQGHCCLRGRIMRAVVLFVEYNLDTNI